MANQKNENSQHQDNLEDKLYKELEEKLNKIESNFEQNVKEELEQLVEKDSFEELRFDNEQLQNKDFDTVQNTDLPLTKVELTPTFKNSYIDKINVASKKREEALKKGSNKYIKYSSIGMEMIGSVLLGGFGGNWLDKKLEFSFPLFTIILILLGLGATFTHLIMQLNADRKAEEEEAKKSKS
ncbi:AtpZ/AtpI family protein [Bernardetia sp. ABR2-2B]|uniref:AtpZ/AtpI family protein n=1 Tax=Bernardetia sp. ABR2-2B TaxID=3127472 RepID=UPI0030D15F25